MSYSETDSGANIVNNHLFGINNRDNLNANGHTNENYDEETFNLDLSEAFIKLSGYSIKEFRTIKLEIEQLIREKIKNLDKNETKQSERCVYFMKDFSIDKVGNPVLVGETGISEGWNVPIYKNEYQNLLGLPFTEDHALADSLRIKRPRQECFNCLATNHGVRDCPIKQNEERISIHREFFNSQSLQSNEQMNLFTNRYTNDLDTKVNRGFIPGKISDDLRQALGIKSNQLPPFIYIMRDLGYPIGWLIEAQVSKAKLAVLNGDSVKNDESILDEDESFTKDNEEDLNSVEYDPNRIFTFPGFNEKPASDTIDESDKFNVKRYSSEMSKEQFLNTLNLEKKKIVGRNITELKNNDIDMSCNYDDSEKNLDGSSSTDKPNSQLSTGSIEEEEEIYCLDSIPNKRRKSLAKSELGISFTEIPGTPIVNNVAEINRVPDWDKFSENICEHKPYEMNAHTPTGSYRTIVKLTKEFKSSLGSN